MATSPATFEEQLAYDLKHGTSKQAATVLLGYNDKGNPVYGPNPDAGASNYGIDVSSPAGISSAINMEVARRRRLIADGTTGEGGFAQLPPDVADLFFRDGATGTVRRARGGSTRSALLGAFQPAAPIGPSSILGNLR